MPSSTSVTTFSRLMSPAHRSWRIVDFAADARFGSDATFIRAFRRQFGMTPGEVRLQAELARGGAGPPLTTVAAWFDSTRWTRQPLG